MCACLQAVLLGSLAWPRPHLETAAAGGDPSLRSFSFVVTTDIKIYIIEMVCFAKFAAFIVHIIVPAEFEAVVDILDYLCDSFYCLYHIVCNYCSRVCITWTTVELFLFFVMHGHTK